MEVGRDRQAVVEVRRIDDLAGAADMEDDRHASLFSQSPHRIQAVMAGGVVGRTTRGDEQRGGAHVQTFLGHGFGPIEVGEWHVTGGQHALVDVAEVDHASVVGTSCAIGQIEIAAVFPPV